MKKHLTLILLALSLTAMADDKKMVTETLNKHLNGIKKGDLELVKEAWDMDHAVIRTVTLQAGKETVASVDVKKSLISWTQKENPQTRWTIESVDVINSSLASVRLKLQWQGAELDESLTLVKVSGNWKIISKVFTVKAGKAMKKNPYAL